MPIRLVSKTLEITAGGYAVVIRQLNARQFKIFAHAAIELKNADGKTAVDKLVVLLTKAIIKFKDSFEAEDGKALTTVEDILWELDLNELKDLSSDIIATINLDGAQSKNLNSSSEQSTVAPAGDVKATTPKKESGNIPAKTEPEHASTTRRGKTKKGNRQ